MMRKPFLLLSFLLLGWLQIGLVQAASTLKEIKSSVTPNGEIVVTLVLDGAAPEVASFTIDQPARLSVDLPDTILAVAQRKVTIDKGVVRTLRALESGGRSRLVISLDYMVPYTIRTENNSIFILFTPNSISSIASAAPLDQEQNINRASDDLPIDDSPQVVAGRISAIDFKRGGAGEAKISIGLSDPSAIVDIRKKGTKILIDFLGQQIDEKLIRRMDVIDFATPVEFIDTLRTEKGVQVQILPLNDSYDYLAYQADGNYQIELKPLTAEEAEEKKKDEMGYIGEKLSLNFQNIEVRAVLQLIADFTGLNIVVSDTVQGSITLRLKNVPWDQALDIILKTRGLGKRQTGNVMLIAPNEELTDREKKELETQRSIVELAPLRTEFIQINYAKAVDIAALIKSGDKQSILSARGQVTIDERTNTLMILDTASKIEDILRIIRELDIPVRQVLIESRIVIASDSFGRELGFQAGVTRVNEGGSNVVTGSLAGANDTISAFTSGSGQTFPSQSGRMNVSLPVSAPSGRIAMSILNSNQYLVDLELSAMQAEGKGELVSNPRIITSNQMEATIEQGIEIPYQEASSSGATSVSFKKAVLSLKVTPQITPDNRVVMDLTVDKDNVSQIVAGGIPAIDTRSIKTQVLVDNGDTVVLGGIYENEKLNSVDKVPLLGDIPIIGILFRRTVNRDNKSELLVFVTPKILDEKITPR